MKKEGLILCILLALLAKPCISQTIEWANANHGAGYEVAADAVGNLYEKTKSI